MPWENLLGCYQVFGNRTGAFRLKKRSILFRLGAVLLGLLPFLLFELVLQSIGWQQPDSISDPYVGFSSIRPLFEVDDTGERYEISKSRYPLFCPESFLIDKPSDEFRIFCVGGSTVQGRPFAIETAFSTWLELRLQAVDPTKQWNVINCGGVSYASYRLTPIMDEIMAYQPDLIVLYTGHNEFLEDRTYESVKTTPRWAVQAHERLSAIKTYSFVRSLFVGEANSDPASTPKTKLPVEVEARLDFRDGLAEYHRDDDWKRDVVQHFQHNLRRMVMTARKANVRLILCNPVSNLRDAAPFKSENGAELSTVELRQFIEGWESISLEDGATPNPVDDLVKLKQLLKIDPRHAGLQYRIGQTYQQLGEFKQAKQHLLRAKEEDVCPLRMIEPMYNVIAVIANEFDLPLVDVKEFFEGRASDGIPGRESLVDHVHPSIHGHQLISGLLMDEMIRSGWVESSGVSSDSERLFASHLESLPYLYFELGKDRLAGLKRWAEGKVTREKAE